MMVRTVRRFFFIFVVISIGCGCDNTLFQTKKTAPLITDQEEFTRQIEIPANVHILEFHHRGGNITLTGWDQSYILIEGTVRASAETVEMARSIIEMVEVIAYERPINRLVLDYEGPAGFARGKVPEEGMDYTAHVPLGMVIDLASEKGNVQVSNIEGDVFIQHKEGDARVEAIRGNLTVEVEGRKDADNRVTVTSVRRNLSLKTRRTYAEISRIEGESDIEHEGGEFMASDLGGKMTFNGKDSALAVYRAQGYLQVNNAGGDVLCDSFYDGIQAEVRNGTLKLEPKVPVTRSYNCLVKHGNLIFRIPDNSSMLLELVAANGSITSEYPLQVSAEGKMSYAKGAIGQGFPQVHLEAERGSISILREIPGAALSMPAPDSGGEVRDSTFEGTISGSDLEPAAVGR